MARVSVATREELIAVLSELRENEKLLAECLSICSDYGKSATDFYYTWEARRFKGSTKIDSAIVPELTSEDALSLRQEFRRESEKTAPQKVKGKEKPMTNLMGSMLQGRGVPTRKPKLPDAGTVGVTFIGPTTDEKKKRKFRYMYETANERSQVLDDRIDELGDLLRNHYDIVDFGDPNSMSENDVFVVGRICSEADASSVSSSSSKLGEGSIYLESSRYMGSGTHRVLLRFNPQLRIHGIPEGSGGYGIFPGAIVAAKGKNGGGNCFVVDEIYAIPPISSNEVDASKSHKAFTMVTACGPFTSDGDLTFNPFSSLMKALSVSRPSVLLLLGPFIDASHPRVKSGRVEQSPSEMFKEHIGDPIQSFLSKSPDSLVLLVPSVRDILSDHPVLPQSELDIIGLSDSRIKFLPNPCRFSINNVSFAVTSTDVLFHLRNQESVLRGQEVDPTPCPAGSANDMVANSCRHILQQRSFYPLFPTPAEFACEVNLDITHSKWLKLETDTEAYAPDIIILPSKLKQFSKIVDSALIVNPSFLTKATYASVSIPAVVHSNLSNSIRCEIVKL